MHFKIGFENDLIPIHTYLLCRRRRRPVFTSNEEEEEEVSLGALNTRTYTQTQNYNSNKHTEHISLDCLFCFSFCFVLFVGFAVYLCHLVCFIRAKFKMLRKR